MRHDLNVDAGPIHDRETLHLEILQRRHRGCDRSYGPPPPRSCSPSAAAAALTAEEKKMLFYRDDTHGGSGPSATETIAGRPDTYSAEGRE